MTGNLVLKMVRARGEQLTPFVAVYGGVTYCCEQGGPSAIYIELQRPSHRNGIELPATVDMKITITGGMPFSKKAVAEFCGPKIDAFIAALSKIEAPASIPLVLEPLLKGELNQFVLTPK